VLGSLLAATAARADTVRARCDVFPAGSVHASASLPCTFSQRGGHVAIDRADGVRHELSPSGPLGTFVDELGRPAYRQRGLGERGLVFRLATESVHVLWDPSGLPGGAPATPETGPGPGRFDLSLALHGVGFRVTCPNDGSRSTLTIVPSGLEIEAAPITRTVDGTVTGAEVADLDADGSPELYVYVTSAGSGSYGSLVAFATSGRKSLGEILQPPLPEGAAAAAGYRGHDRFEVAGDVLLRRFPVYRDGDSNAAPSGGTRRLRYRLVRGEAGWRLGLDDAAGP
jgi:hypothetical protein